MSSPRIMYAPRPDATPEAELGALAAIYKLCLSSHANRSATGVASTKGDDATVKYNKEVNHVNQRTSFLSGIANHQSNES